jgi:hypothetical protein
MPHLARWTEPLRHLRRYGTWAPMVLVGAGRWGCGRRSEVAPPPVSRDAGPPASGAQPDAPSDAEGGIAIPPSAEDRYTASSLEESYSKAHSRSDLIVAIPLATYGSRNWSQWHLDVADCHSYPFSVVPSDPPFVHQGLAS